MHYTRFSLPVSQSMYWVALKPGNFDQSPSPAERERERETCTALRTPSGETAKGLEGKTQQPQRHLWISTVSRGAKNDFQLVQAPTWGRNDREHRAAVLAKLGGSLRVLLVQVPAVLRPSSRWMAVQRVQLHMRASRESRRRAQ